jgi:VIT1/CCC1 family predicted Fe2+/Mn2+ transporter
MAASNILSQRSHADHMPTLRQTLPRGSATFVGFLVAGLAPLIAYLIPWPDAERFALSVTLASVTLFAVGAGRAWVTPRHWFAAGLEMLLIGIGAGMIAYGVGALGAWLTGGVM